jgi:O-antigen ligase
MASNRIHTLGILCLALSWLAYDHYRPWVNFHSEVLALLGIGLLALGLCIAQKIRHSLAPRAVWWVAAYALVPWLQYVMGVSLYAGDSLIASLYLAALAAGIWLGYGYAAYSTAPAFKLSSVFYMLWFAALASAGIGLLQWFNLQGPLQMYVVQTDIGDRAMGNLGQPNQLATLLLMGMAALAWTFETRRIGVLGFVLGIALMTLSLVLTLSRAGLLGAMVVATFLIWKNLNFPGRLAPKFIAGWTVAYCALILALPSIQQMLLMGGGGRTMNPGIDSARVVIWKQVLSGISQSPWLGYGWNQTPTAHSAGSVMVPGTMTYTNAHNIILDVIAWNGVPLGILMTVVCAYWFFTRMRAANQLTAVYGMACLLPVAVHSMVEYPFAYSYFLVCAGLMAGIVEASHKGIKPITLNLKWLRCA